jgi:CRP-like cAMP-binding protein
MQGVHQKIAFFELLDPTQRKYAEENARARRIRKGQTIIEHGSRSSDVYFLVEGELRVLLYSADGRQVSVRTLKPGQMFGELAAIDELPRSATIVAVVTSMVVAMARHDFQKCIETSASASFWLAKQFATQIRSLTDKIFELSTLNVRNRLHCELLRSAQPKSANANQSSLKPSPTHVEFANRIGTHREAVTRELRDLVRRGIVEQDRRSLTILDIARLSAEVQHLSGRTVGIYPANRVKSALSSSPMDSRP